MTHSRSIIISNNAKMTHIVSHFYKYYNMTMTHSRSIIISNNAKMTYIVGLIKITYNDT